MPSTPVTSFSEKDFILIDTAGIRKKKSVREDVEFYTVIQAIKAIDEADVCILMIDADRCGRTDLTILQNHRQKKKRVCGHSGEQMGCSRKDHHHHEVLYGGYQKSHRSLSVMCPSYLFRHLKRPGYSRQWESSLQVMENKETKVATSVLNETLLPIIEATPPPTVKGQLWKISISPSFPARPRLLFFTNYPKDIKKDSYRQFLETSFDRNIPVLGVPSIFSSARSNSHWGSCCSAETFLLMAITWNQPQTTN